MLARLGADDGRQFTAQTAHLSSDEAGDALERDLVASGRGDRKAFRKVYAATAGRLLAICLSVTRERGAAEDVLQEVFVKIWRKASSYNPERARPMSWLATIARNSAIDWRRSRRIDVRTQRCRRRKCRL